MKTDYSDFIGKEYIHRYSSGNTTTGIIVGADYWTGISAVDANNPEVHLLCLNRSIHVPKHYTPADYRKVFQFMITSIKAGEYDCRLREMKTKKIKGKGIISGSNCAFK